MTELTMVWCDSCELPAVVNYGPDSRGACAAHSPFEEVAFCGCTNERLEAGRTCGQPQCPNARLPHCTLTFGGHSPLCDRNGRFCSAASDHIGPCKPHGAPDLTDWAPGEVTEAFGS